MSICDACQSFVGNHEHHAPAHPTFCTCDGTDKSRRPIVDEGVMLTVRLADLTAQGDEMGDKDTPGVYTGKDVLVWSAVKRRLAGIWRD